MEFKGRQLQAGDLREWISIEQDESIRSATGHKTPWQTVKTVCQVWAAMVYERDGAESVPRDTPVSIQGVAFYIRRRTDIHPKMRVSASGRNFEIGAMQHGVSGSGHFMKLICREVLSQ